VTADAAGIADDRKGWLFRTARRHNGSVLSDHAMSQPDAWRMIRRRAAVAGIAASIVTGKRAIPMVGGIQLEVELQTTEDKIDSAWQVHERE
jgi:hypothetical protein